jgi:RNA polymerase sigma-70 factor (ECF subfamily)
LNIDIDVYYEKYLPMVLRRCRGILGDEEDALDTAQDVFVKLLEARTRLHGRFPSSLLYTIATNACLNRLRWKKRHGEVPYEAQDDLGGSDRAWEQVEAKVVMEGILKTESESTRAICYMYHADGMTFREIGEAVGMSVSGVRKRLTSFNARARLRYEGENGL